MDAFARLKRELQQRLDELGLDLHSAVPLAEMDFHDPVAATLKHRRNTWKTVLTLTDRLTARQPEWPYSDLPRDVRVFLLGPQVNSRSADLLRASGVNYLDEAGNAFIDVGGTYIDIQGKRAKSASIPSAPRRASRGGANLFSTGRAQVAFALLAWPELADMRMQDLATAADVSVGLVQNTIDLLADHGYLDKHRRVVPGRLGELVDEWTAAYSKRFDRQANFYSGDITNLPLVGEFPDGGYYFLSGESALPGHIRAETAMIYSDQVPPTHLIRERRWRRVEERPTVIVRHRFWRSPRETETSHPEPVHPLLIYADLMAAGDSRSREVAADYRRIVDRALER